MIESLKPIIWHQFGASIEMLKNAIVMCPETYWNTEKKFWYNAYHTLFFLDYYLTLDAKTFLPPAPFTLSEFEDTMPERIYNRDELLTYTEYCRLKCHALIMSLTEESAKEYWENESKTMRYNIIEILLYNMRHVQHHAGQLNIFLRQDTNDAPDWVYDTTD